MKVEPSIIIGALSTFATAIVGLLIAFGIDVSDDQREAIVTAIAATVPVIFLTTLVVRQFVYSPRSVEKIANRQYDAGVPPVEPQPEIPGPGEVR